MSTDRIILNDKLVRIWKKTAVAECGICFEVLKKATEIVRTVAMLAEIRNRCLPNKNHSPLSSVK